MPPVRIAGGRLRFELNGPLRVAKGLPGRLAFDFARLAGSSEKSFLEFARTWGPLGICPHRTTVHHKSPPCLEHLVGDELLETISSWRGQARQVLAMLNIRTALNRGELGTNANWRAVWPGSPPTNRSAAAGVLGIVASTFLSKMNAQPILQCVDDRLTIAFIGGNFLNILKAMAASDRIARWLSSSGALLAEIAVRTTLALQEGAGWRSARTRIAAGSTDRDGMLQKADFISAAVAASVHLGGCQNAERQVVDSYERCCTLCGASLLETSF